MRILLLSVPALEEVFENFFPLGLGYLAGELKKSHEVKAYHYQKMSLAKKDTREKISFFKPEVIGLTCNTFNRGNVRLMIRFIRRIDKNIKIVVGGVHASFCYEQILKQYGADAVVVGEGEYKLKELCDALEKNTPLELVKGIAYKKNNEVVLTSCREAVDNLDDLAMPDYEYARPYIERSKMGFVITSRGCPVRCTFCSTSSFWGQKVRMNSVQRVVDEIEMLISDFKVKKIFFHDDTFNLGIFRVKAICEEIIARGIKIEWGCLCRVTPVSEDMIALMVEAGCRYICWGVETGSEKILKKLNKNITFFQIKNAFEISNKFANLLSTAAFTMVGNPGETPETIEETVKFLNTLPFTDRLRSMVLYVLPGTLLYEGIKKEGYVKDENWFKYDTVPNYTLENSFRTLLGWSRRIDQSGKRVPFDPRRHFWFGSEIEEPEKNIVSMSRLFLGKLGILLLRPKKVIKIIKGFLPAGRIRF